MSERASAHTRGHTFANAMEQDLCCDMFFASKSKSNTHQKRQPPDQSEYIQTGSKDRVGKQGRETEKESERERVRDLINMSTHRIVRCSTRSE